MSYLDWIICDPYFKGDGNSQYAARRAARGCSEDGEGNDEIMWSPRRHHASVSFEVKLLPEGAEQTSKKQYLFVMGGRARELINFRKEHSVGGISPTRVKDPKNPSLLYSTQREGTVLKSDVWRSENGRDWTLVTPGCEAPQDTLITRGRKRLGYTQEYKFGLENKKCKSDSDCFGAEYCELNVRYWYEDGETELDGEDVPILGPIPRTQYSTFCIDFGALIPPPLPGVLLSGPM